MGWLSNLDSWSTYEFKFKGYQLMKLPAILKFLAVIFIFTDVLLLFMGLAVVELIAGIP